MQNAWMATPDSVSLGVREVQIWRVALDRPQVEVAQLERCLAPDEVARTARFHFEHLRRRYVVSRGVLRLLLGRTLSVPAGEIRFQYGAKGKPSLATEHQSDVQFNVAHSHELALVALMRGPALGVDVEYRRQLDDAERIARRFFSPQEVEALMLAPAAERNAAFFRIWTRKEAFIKATGKGLSQPLTAFNVMAQDGQALVHVELDGTVTRWRLIDLVPDPHYGAALAVWTDGEEPVMSKYQF